jgi:tetratricopeptide (TPR) repeat protein
VPADTPPPGPTSLVRLIEAAEDGPEVPETFGRLLRESERLLKQAPGSADAHYARGYTLYLLGAHAEARAAFERAELLRRGHQWALFHLIVLAYRDGDHGAVLGAFSRLERAYFEGEDQLWRYLVAWQYELCSAVRLGLDEHVAARLPELIGEYTARQDDPEEILERPGRLLQLYGEQPAGPLRDLLREQLARLVPGGWIRPDDL